MKIQPTESEIQKLCIEYLELKKFKVIRLNAGDHFKTYKDKIYRIKGMESGIPDILAFKQAAYKGERIDGVNLYFIEIKRLGKKATPLQTEKMKELSGFGARCLIASSIGDLQKEGI